MVIVYTFIYKVVAGMLSSYVHIGKMCAMPGQHTESSSNIGESPFVHRVKLDISLLHLEPQDSTISRVRVDFFVNIFPCHHELTQETSLFSVDPIF